MKNARKTHPAGKKSNDVDDRREVAEAQNRDRTVVPAFAHRTPNQLHASTYGRKRE